ncbi:MAG: aminotransferase class V-fold PLP-dependent enzyme [Tildeniella nuda ZEHNDER 1965/U140]|jgi:2-aminoethylphosphonate-pyruvate transaminase|nr:aminotransferase class V-fold PLP-dependent enzyme [Tildeniella nuda ZEHNDER 1965/U140]
MSHREPVFAAILERLCQRLEGIVGGTETHSCVPFAASGTGANEAILASLEGKLLLLDNGRYAKRIGEIARRHQLNVRIVATSPMEPINLEAIQLALDSDPYIKYIFVVHLQTTTGFLAPLQKIGEIADRYGCQLLVDGIASIGGHEFDIVAHNVAFCSLNANKCLEGLPGVSFVIGRTDLISASAGKSRSFYLDIHEQWRACKENRATPYTAPVQLLAAADIAVGLLVEETVPKRICRYQTLRDQLQQGLLDLGLELALVSPDVQSNILSLFRIPHNVNYSALQQELNQRGAIVHTHQEIVDAGYMAIATLGHMNSENVAWFLTQLSEALPKVGKR